MKHKPQKLTFRFASVSAAVSAVMVIVASWSAPAMAQDAAADAAANSDSPTSPVVTELGAQDVLESVRERLESLPFLECSLYETVHLSDLRFYAKGRYVQANGNRIRLEFEIYPIRGVRQTDKTPLQLDGEPEDTGKQQPSGELIQVSDGNALWSYWKNGDSTRLTRRNIQEILKVAGEAEDFDTGQMLEDLGAGGMQALIARLQVGMEFSKVREQTTGDLRLFVITGRWTAKSLLEYFQVEDPTAPRPGWMPDYIRVYVDAEAMLPRRIQYLKKHPNPEQKQVRPLITLDFRDMTVSDTIDETQFQFEAPEGQLELDLTEPTIKAIQQAANPQEATDTTSDSPDAAVSDSDAAEVPAADDDPPDSGS